MGRLSASMIAVLLTLATALGLVACGEDDADLLPGSTATEINSNLDQIDRLAAAGDCEGAADATEQVSAQVEGLEGVDAKLKRALGEGVARLREVVAGCEETATEVEEEESEPVIEPEEEEPEEREESEEPKREKEKQEKQESEADNEAEEPDESGSLPPQANGEAKGHEQGESEAPPAEPGGGEQPSGGVSPGAPVGEG